MADRQGDFPALDNESGITESEREEIRAHIEKIGTENRLPVEATQYSVGAARRGVLLPFVVNGAAVVLIALAAILLGLVFRREDRTVHNQATQYASVEGKLIRELRLESRQQLDSKDKEISDVKARLKDLESQRDALEASYADKLKQKEAELQQRLQSELAAERQRLVGAGVQSAEVETRMKAFEAERRAYYDRQLQEYRKQLDAEKAQLQADINRLRTEYNSRLSQLEHERSQMAADYDKRAAALQIQLEQRTQVLDRLRAQSSVDIEAAERELSQLNRQQERVSTVENQIEGQAARIRDSLGKGDAAEALSRVHDLQAYLQQDTVRSIPQLTNRVRTELFLLDQLGTFLDERVKSAAGGQSLTNDLALLGQLRQMFQDAGKARDDAARLEIYKQLVGLMPEVQSASSVLADAAVNQAMQDFAKKNRDATQKDTQEAVALVAAGDYAGALEHYKAALNETPALSPDTPRIVGDLLQLGYSMSHYTMTGTKDASTDALAADAPGVNLDADRKAFLAEVQRALSSQRQGLETDASASLAAANQSMADALAAQKADLQKQIDQADAQRIKDLDALATQAGTTRQQLSKRLSDLLVFEKQVKAVEAAYTTYGDRDKSARQANPSDPLTASRQELNRFLRDTAVTSLFSDIADRVNAIYAATQNAGASAALADAASIIDNVSKQPNAKASRQLLQFELKNAAGNDRLKAILTAVDDMLAKAQAPATTQNP